MAPPSPAVWADAAGAALVVPCLMWMDTPRLLGAIGFLPLLAGALQDDGVADPAEHPAEDAVGAACRGGL